ncbi:MAG: Clp protease ClpP [Lachnospiraceae bacterium]|nr:Clp protease ClpP [Lachnospiraceae bacterium]
MKKTTKTATAKAPVPYFSLSRNEEEHSAEIFIFGDIASKRGGLAGLLQSKSDQSSYDLANQIAGIPEDYAITVHINSNGGEVKEGLAIYNTLKSRDVTTICEGFAASAASVIFCAGKKRIMQAASLLFIHQASMIAEGNADDFRKASEDLEIITSAATAAYIECGLNIDEEELKKMMRAETWITPENAVKCGFATDIADSEESEEPTNSAMTSIMKAVTRKPNNIEIGFKDGVVDEIKKMYDAVNTYGNALHVLNKIADAINDDPELVTRIKEFATSFIATNPTPNPAKVENKGFFNLK